MIIILKLSECVIPISYDYHESSDVSSVLLNKLPGAHKRKNMSEKTLARILVSHPPQVAN